MATILVADDDVVGRELSRVQLELGGHQMLEAADGAQALAIARTNQLDLVITDVLMPRMDGYDFVLSCANCRGPPHCQ
jgi:CheY-like chemotaxis protein